MVPAKSKAIILKRLQAERARLEQTLSSLSQEQMLGPVVVGEWTVKDVLAHLADWEAHMLTWVTAARSGDPVEHPDPGLTWKQLNIFNQRIYEAHRDQPLEKVFEYFRSIHEQFMMMVEGMPDHEILTSGVYPFLGKGSIYGWLDQYADHDRWGNIHIRKMAKTRHQPAKNG
jgi:hypothetical protein